MPSGLARESPMKTQPINRKMYILLLRKHNVNPDSLQCPVPGTNKPKSALQESHEKNHSEIPLSMRRVGIH